MRGGTVPVIFGIKLKQYREERGYRLKEFAERAGISPSYLTEIEKGKKYPKTEKILMIAEALAVPYDELVSLKLEHGLNHLESLLDSPILRELPLQLFGISQQDVIGLITKAPKKAVALVRTLDEISRRYDLQVEHFFYAMLRSYQETYNNFFEDIEQEVERLVAKRGWDVGAPLEVAQLAEALTGDFGVVIDKETISAHPEVSGFRSIWVKGTPEKLLLNPRLTAAQQAFQIGRELGIRLLGLEERGIASSRAEVTSFEQVLNDFKASYFAGALMINQQRLTGELEKFLGNESWDGPGFLSMMQGYGVTPEMFLYRLTQIIPKYFNINHLHFLRFSNKAGTSVYHLTKHFNLSPAVLPAGIGQNEHYCRRWLPVQILERLSLDQERGDTGSPIIGAQIARYLNSDTEYFYFSLARPLLLTPGMNTSMTLGFELNSNFRKRVRFWRDPAIPRQELNETCERCGLTAKECGDRAAPATVKEQIDAARIRREALQGLLAEINQG